MDWKKLKDRDSTAFDSKPESLQFFVEIHSTPADPSRCEVIVDQRHDTAANRSIFAQLLRGIAERLDTRGGRS